MAWSRRLSWPTSTSAPETVSNKAMPPDGRGRPSPCFSLFRSEEHTSELQSLMRISYAVFCLKKKTNKTITQYRLTNNTKQHRVNTNLIRHERESLKRNKE